MPLLPRIVEAQVLTGLQTDKVVMLLGPRRVGKTVLLEQIIKKSKEPHLLLNGEDLAAQELLERRTIAHYKSTFSSISLLVIDEAQKIPDIGAKLKLIVDHVEGLKILVSGSSSFDLQQHTGEPLTGRKITLNLFALAEQEYDSIENILERKDKLHDRLVYGNYPELLSIMSNTGKAAYLRELVNDYLLKDILAIDGIRASDKMLALLKLIAFQVGQEVSHQELGRQLNMSKNTVEKYLDLLAKLFVIYRIGGFSKNLRKEVSKNSRWYFHDNGLRNTLIANFNPLSARNDQGVLWENYMISERIKFQNYHNVFSSNYFWRTYDQQEIDWVEEREGQLFAYEFKWNAEKKPKTPVAWAQTYPEAEFRLIHPGNYADWVRPD
ncbi:MAG: AAA family ATPase [Bacteroidetes bacterium]|nr:AAA family ATPase [Bacteroidota bacterium]